MHCHKQLIIDKFHEFRLKFASQSDLASREIGLSERKPRLDIYLLISHLIIHPPDASVNISWTVL